MRALDQKPNVLKHGGNSRCENKIDKVQHTEGDYTNRQNRTSKHKNVIVAKSPPCFREGSGKNEDRPAQAQILETIISQPCRPFLSSGQASVSETPGLLRATSLLHLGGFGNGNEDWANIYFQPEGVRT